MGAPFACEGARARTPSVAGEVYVAREAEDPFVGMIRDSYFEIPKSVYDLMERWCSS